MLNQPVAAKKRETRAYTKPYVWLWAISTWSVFDAAFSHEGEIIHRRIRPKNNKFELVPPNRVGPVTFSSALTSRSEPKAKDITEFRISSSF